MEKQYSSVLKDALALVAFKKENINSNESSSPWWHGIAHLTSRGCSLLGNSHLETSAFKLKVKTVIRSFLKYSDNSILPVLYHITWIRLAPSGSYVCQIIPLKVYVILLHFLAAIFVCCTAQRSSLLYHLGNGQSGIFTRNQEHWPIRPRSPKFQY